METWSDEYITLQAANITKVVNPVEEHLIGEIVSRDPSKGATPRLKLIDPTDTRYPLCEVCYHHHPVNSHHLD